MVAVQTVHKRFIMTSKNGEMTSQDSKYGAIEFNFFVYKKVITNNV